MEESYTQTEQQSNAQTQPTRQPLNFGQTMLASAVGIIVASAVLSIISFIAMIIMIISMMGSIDKSDSVTVKDGSFVKIDLSQHIQEAAPNMLENAFSEEKVISAEDILETLHAAKNDNRIKGVYIACGASDLSWGLSEELRNAIIDFRTSGKPVICYGEMFTQPIYYLATAADRICLHTDGVVDFRGIGAQLMFYKDLFDKLGMKVDLIRPTSCAYKSAGEPYIMNHMSEANREQIHAYINSIWSHAAHNMADARHMSYDSINTIADQLSGYLAKGAYKSGLVDTLCYEYDIKQLLDSTYGRKHTISVKKYAKAVRQNKEDSNNEIAVIYAEGTVKGGRYPGYGTGVYGDRIAKAIDDAVKDDDVKAIVLRVNSPGGAATASQTMTAAVRRAKKVKPVVVSMSDLAASAGYEMSCLADKIVAQPTTITGSIGVFGTLPEVGNMLKKKIGITFDTAQTNHNSTGLSLVGLSPTARAMMQQNVEDFYVTFVSTVALGRKMSYEAVDSIAKGRVWTGADALKLGLVDTLGGIDLAFRIAADLAGIKDYSIVHYPNPKDWMEQLMAMLGNDDEDSDGSTISLRALFQARKAIRHNTLERQIECDIRGLAEEPCLQARLPYFININ